MLAHVLMSHSESVPDGIDDGPLREFLKGREATGTSENNSSNRAACRSWLSPSPTHWSHRQWLGSMVRAARRNPDGDLCPR